MEVADAADQEGHPVYVFKQENLAFCSGPYSVSDVSLKISVSLKNEDFKSDPLNGLRHHGCS